MEKPEAKFWAADPGDKVRCLLCPQACRIAEGRRGVCRIRENRGGRLIAAGYAETTSTAVDPIEKKPLYHFFPGSTILSLGPNGCNLRCDFCQNWRISQGKVPTEEVPPELAVETAKRNGCVGIAFTYSEPCIWYEYVRDTAALARERGLAAVMVSNGYINEDPLREILPHIDAWNIDLKSIRDAYYRDFCGGSVEPVKRSIRLAAGVCHVEVTNLVIPTRNDSNEDLRELVDFVASVRKDIPLHFSRYFPRHKADIPSTPEETLEKAYRIAAEKLDFVYLGNVEGRRGADTDCAGCGRAVVRRRGYSCRDETDTSGRCPSCGKPIAVKAARADPAEGRRRP